MPALSAEFGGKIDLIYIDPPFATGQDFSMPVNLPEGSFTKEPSMIEVKAYRDTWGEGLDSYLRWFYELALFMHDLLATTGSLYVHLDPGMSHPVKVLLDEVFGKENFRSEIIWKRSSAHNSARRWGPVHDVILFYTKSDSYTWNEMFTALPDTTAEQWYNNVEEGTDKRYNRADLTARGTRSGSSGATWRGTNPTAKGRHWAIPRLVGDIVGDLDTLEALDALDAAGRIHWPKDKSGVPMLKRYLDESPGIAAQDIISDIYINNIAAERVGYPTQKPEALLSRIIEASSNPGDLVLDCLCGSGTTAVAAEKLGRRWLACDLSRFAIHMARKRMLGIAEVKPFVVQNLGKYERQAWQAAEFPSNGKDGVEQQRRREVAYRKFVLDLYHATPRSGSAWLHGMKSGRMVHVGAVDAPVTLADVKSIAREAWKALGAGEDSPKKAAVDILGWDFAFELNELAKQIAAQSRVDVMFRKIPREVLDKRAIAQGDVQFFELGALDVGVKQKKRDLTISLDDFLIPYDDIPRDVQNAIKNWSQLIDYWAVDWDFKDDTFHNQWQTYRTRKDSKIVLETSHTYENAGVYNVVIKVIDVLGNDTTKTISITVR